MCVCVGGGGLQRREKKKKKDYDTFTDLKLPVFGFSTGVMWFVRKLGS